MGFEGDGGNVADSIGGDREMSSAPALGAAAASNAVRMYALFHLI